MKLIKLTQGKQTIVDDDDYEELSKYKWHIRKTPNNYYASRQRKRINGKQKSLPMHSIIMSTPTGMDTDHINGNGLDNRKSNLRICLRYQNSRNMRPKKYKRKGAYRRKNSSWMAGIRKNGKQIWLGTFKTETDAARVYNEAAKKYYGEFARINYLGE